jgi:hypothetical protein
MTKTLKFQKRYPENLAVSLALLFSSSSHEALAYTYQNPTGNPEYVISSCQEISRPGVYRLAANFQTTAGLPHCFRIAHTRDVQLQCAGKSIGPIQILEAQNFSIRDCRIEPSASQNALNIFRSRQGEVISSQLLGEGTLARIESSSELGIRLNHFGGRLRLEYVEQALVTENVFQGFPLLDFAENGVQLEHHLVSRFGSANRFQSNLLTQNPAMPVRQLSGILLQDEHGSVVRMNMIQGMRTGIELAGRIYNALIERNVVRASELAIGGSRNLSVIKSRILQNSVSESNVSIGFTRQFGLRHSGFDPQAKAFGDIGVYFQDNAIDGNISAGSGLNPTHVELPVFSKMGYLGTIQPGELKPQVDHFFLSGNTVRNNDFSGATLNLGASGFQGMLSDGGQNACEPFTPNGPHHLSCSPAPQPGQTIDSGSASDSFYSSSGTVAAVTYPQATGTSVSQLTSTRALRYSIPVPNGRYQVRLQFSENEFTQSGQRLFNISVGGSTVLNRFDILGFAGGANREIELAFPITVTNGAALVVLTPVQGKVTLSGVRILGFGPSMPAMVTLAPSPTALPVPPKRLFVSSTRVNGAVGSLGAADATCTRAAEATGLGGTWTALLSSSQRTAISRLPNNSTGWQLVNLASVGGPRVFANRTSVAQGPAQPINITERGEAYDGYVFTGSTAQGSSMAGRTCMDWTSTGGWGAFGYSSQTGGSALGGQSTACMYSLPLYCFER